MADTRSSSRWCRPAGRRSRVTSTIGAATTPAISVRSTPTSSELKSRAAIFVIAGEAPQTTITSAATMMGARARGMQTALRTCPKLRPLTVGTHF